MVATEALAKAAKSQFGSTFPLLFSAGPAISHGQRNVPLGGGAALRADYARSVASLREVRFQSNQTAAAVKQGKNSMTTSYRRITLLAGASITALGLASPALAAPHDGLPQGNYTNTDSPSITNTPGVDVTDTLEILPSCR